METADVMHWQLPRAAKPDGVVQATQIGSTLLTQVHLEMEAAVLAFTQKIKFNSQRVSPPTTPFCHGAGTHSTLHSYTLGALTFLSDNAFAYRLNPHNIVYNVKYF
jgi:hypothetical protein